MAVILRLVSFVLDVELLLQDAVDEVVAWLRVFLEGQGAGVFQAFWRVSLGELQERDADPVGLLFDGIRLETLADDLVHRRPDLLRPAEEARSVPERIELVLFRHVLGKRRVLVPASHEARMHGDAFAVVQDFNDSAGDPRIHLLVDVLVRDGIILVGNADVVVDADRRFLPFRALVLHRWERLQERRFLFLESGQARAVPLLEGCLIEFLELFPDCRIEVAEREERPVAEPRDDGGREAAYRALGSGLVFRREDACGKERRPVVFRHFLVDGIQERIFAPPVADDARLEVVADEQARNAAEEAERMDVGTDPARKLHVRHGLRVSVHAERQDGDEQVRLGTLPGIRIPDAEHAAGPVHHDPVCRLVADVHGEVAFFDERMVMPAKLRIAEIRKIAILATVGVFFPEQLERDALAEKLLVDALAIRQERSRCIRLRWEEQLVYFIFVLPEKRFRIHVLLFQHRADAADGIARDVQFRSNAPLALAQRKKPDDFLVL